MSDRDYMDRALQLAERGRGQTSPNPLVGAVVVSNDGVVVGQGYHRRVGEAHAEIMALDEAGEHARGATLYFMREHRPFVVLKAAMSADGYIAEAPGKRTILTSAEADRHANLFRTEVDAIAVGSETILVDDPLLTARGVYRERPLTRVVFDRRLRTPAHAAILSTLAAGPVMIMTSPAAAASADLIQPLEARGARIEAIEGSSLRAALERLADLGVESLLVEGGSEVHAAAWDEDLVDLVSIYVCPRVIGPDG